MLEQLAKLIELIKTPIRFVIGIVAASATVQFLPQSVISKMGLLKYREESKPPPPPMKQAGVVPARREGVTVGVTFRHAGTGAPVTRPPRSALTGREKDVDVALSTLVGKLNERFGTDFTEADQLFFDQVRSTAERNEKVVEAAQANSFPNFSSYFGRILEDLFIDRMEGNEEIFRRVMSDQQFRGAAQERLAREVYERIRNAGDDAPE